MSKEWSSKHCFVDFMISAYQLYLGGFICSGKPEYCVLSHDIATKSKLQSHHRRVPESASEARHLQCPS